MYFELLFFSKCITLIIIVYFELIKNYLAKCAGLMFPIQQTLLIHHYVNILQVIAAYAVIHVHFLMT